MTLVAEVFRTAIISLNAVICKMGVLFLLPKLLYMTSQEFIFSKRPVIRFSRHLIFWLLFALHFTIQNLMIGGPGEAKTSRKFFESFSHLFYFLPFYLVSTYFFLEIILLYTLYKRRYLLFMISTLMLLAMVITGCLWSGKFYIHTMWGTPYSHVTFAQNKYHILVDGIFVPLMIWGIAGGFKVSKKWYEKQKENEQLAKQKIATEIKLLKVQIHPRFLFHTLHSVQHHIHHLSEQAPAMVLQLADLLSYLLYESDRQKVLVDKEIEIIRSYLGLQQDDTNKSPFTLQVTGNTQNKTITPLILFTFTENYFEYFFEPGHCINHSLLKMEVNADKLLVTLEIDFNNNRLPMQMDKKLSTMKDQLQNLYPEQKKIKTGVTTNLMKIEWEIQLDDDGKNESLKTIVNEEDLAI